MLELIIVFALVLLNGFFAMSEMSVMTSRKSRLKQMAQTSQRAQRASLCRREIHIVNTGAHRCIGHT